MGNFEGDVMSVDAFSNALKMSNYAENVIVEMEVDMDAAIGIVTNVQEIIRKKDALRINYATVNQT